MLILDNLFTSTLRPKNELEILPIMGSKAFGVKQLEQDLGKVRSRGN